MSELHNININSFHINSFQYLFFDMFYKNNKLYLILPIYADPIYADPIYSDPIQIKINNTLLHLTDKKVNDSGEPAMVYIYDCHNVYHKECQNDYIEVTVIFNNITRKYSLQHIKTERKIDLALTTLFKDDYNIFPIFYDYYTKQGVSHFFMYYNGVSTPKIKQVLLRFPNVTLIDWNFQYWTKTCKYEHHAQPAQLNHALYRYGKDICEYMIFCDLDEYLYIPKCSLKEKVLANKEIDTFGFCNKWAKTLDNKTITAFPRSFLCTPGSYNYKVRSKNIHKVDSLNIIGIHAAHEYDINIKEPKLLINFIMFHFYNWSKPKRENKNCEMVVVHF